MRPRDAPRQHRVQHRSLDFDNVRNHRHQHGVVAAVEERVGIHRINNGRRVRLHEDGGPGRRTAGRVPRIDLGFLLLRLGFSRRGLQPQPKLNLRCAIDARAG